MSRISLSGNPSGTGTLTIASPNTNSDATFNLPTTGGDLLVNGAAQAANFSALTVNGNNISATNSLGFRNRIINGDMRIDQRNNGASVTPSNETVTYITDRFYFIRSSSTSPTIRQSTDAPAGFTNSLLFTNASTGTTPDYAQVVQNIEGFNTADLGWGTANAQAITVSFRVKSSLTGTFSVAFRNSATNRSYVTTYTISAANTWETKTVTIPGDTSGTWLTNNGIGISLVYRFGGSGGTSSTNQWTATGDAFASGSVNVMGTANATWQITGVQLEAGSVATPFERRPYGTELALCQRYFRRISSGNASTGGIIGMGAQSSTTGGYAYVSVSPPMRATPTIAGNQLVVSDSATFDTPASVNVVVGTQDSVYLDVSYAASGAQFRPINLRAVTGNTSGRLDMSSEL
jgi:hypothetical protein